MPAVITFSAVFTAGKVITAGMTGVMAAYRRVYDSTDETSPSLGQYQTILFGDRGT